MLYTTNEVIRLNNFDYTVSEALYAKELGSMLLRFTKMYDEHTLARQIESRAVALIQEIRTILNDSTLDDPECFYRIEALVSAFDLAGIPVTCHDW